MKRPFMAAGIISLVLMCISFTAWADSTSWDPYLTEAEMAYDGDAYLFVTPDGSGLPLTQAQDIYGNTVDATLTLWVYDGAGYPLADFPHEDMWLESADHGLAYCIGGTAADADTDTAGMTTWTQPLRAGGHSNANCLIFINGTPLYVAGFTLFFTSPDINGDRVVDLADLGALAHDYYLGYDQRSDFFHDGVLSLPDIGRFAQSFGDHCP